jgi:hypothetical protein
MATVEVPSGNTSKETLTNGETLDVAKGVVFAYAKTAEAVNWSGGGTVTLDVEGQITASGSGARGLDTDSGSLPDGSSLTVNVSSGASIITADDSIRVDGNIASGTVNITNAGDIVSGNYNTSTGAITGTNTGQGIDLQDITSASTSVTITNQAGAVIGSGDSDAIHAGGTITVNNSGKIIAQNDSNAAGSKNDGVNLETSGGTVNNFSTGTIVGAHAGITGNVPTSGSTAITINNSGSITGQLGSGINIDLPDGTTSTAGFTTTTVVNNSTGTITGTAGVDSGGTSIDGDGVDVDGVVNIQNAGTIQALGTSAGTLNEAITVGGGTIVNSGTIESTQRAITLDNSNDENAYAATTINNSGLIDGGDGQAISITDTFADSITNTTTGRIVGDILNGAGSDTISNGGTIDGNITFGLTSSTVTDGADTITNMGTIEGNVAFGSGNDVFNAYTGSTTTGTIDGGTGANTFNLDGTGTGTLQGVTDFQTLDVNGGTWTVADTEAFSTGTTIASGATVQLGSGSTTGTLATPAIADNGSLIVDHSDTVTLSGVSGSGTITQSGTGKLDLGANTFTGGVTIDSGTVDLSSSTAAGTGAITFAPGASAALTIDAGVDPTNTIKGFASGDTINLTGYNAATTTTDFDSTTDVLTVTDGTHTDTLRLSGDYSGEYFHATSSSSGVVISENNSVACYCRETRILTASGEVAVEDLKIGDLLITLSGERRAIKWIGKRSYSGRFANANRGVLPICFKAGSLDGRLPARDLWISPKHAMFIDGVLIAAEQLVNGVSIVQAERVDMVEYFHIELDTHDIIIAEGAASETFVDDASRAMFHNAREFKSLYPHEVATDALYCAPRIGDGSKLQEVRTKLNALAGMSVAAAVNLGPLVGDYELNAEGVVKGWAQNSGQPGTPVCLDILVDGEVVGEVFAEGALDGENRQVFAFALPSIDGGAEPLGITLRRSFDGQLLLRSAIDLTPLSVIAA